MTRTKISHISVEVNSDQMEEAKFPYDDVCEFACQELNRKIEKLENEIGEEATILKIDTRVDSVAVTKKEGLSAYDAKVKYGKLPAQDEFKLKHMCKLDAFICFKIPESNQKDDNTKWDLDNGIMK